MDILESIAGLANIEIEETDSQNLLSTLLGKPQVGRKNVVIVAITRTAFREGNWIMIPPYKGSAIEKQVNIGLGNSDEYLLYNLDGDLAQQTNLAASNPKKLNHMITNFEAIRGMDYKNIQSLELK